MLTRADCGLRTTDRRRGFTLVEVLVVFTILGILGALLTRIMMSQSRFADQQNALRESRSVARQAANILESELRMVQDSGGVDSVSTDGKTIRVLSAFRFGLNCGVASGATVVSMLPVDSLSLAQARYAGFAWRNRAGIYTIVYPGNPLGSDAPASAGDPSQCTGNNSTQAQIRTLTLNGRAGQILDVKPSQSSAPRGEPVFFFQRITYRFASSTLFPGAYGLYRSVQGGSTDEIMAPFDSSSRFKYWTTGASASVSANPGLGLIRGIDVVFVGRSSYTAMGKTAPSKTTVVASIFFKNVRNY